MGTAKNGQNGIIIFSGNYPNLLNFIHVDIRRKSHMYDINGSIENCIGHITRIE